MAICFHICSTCGHFHALAAQLSSSFYWNCVAHKVENINSLSLYRRLVLTPNLVEDLGEIKCFRHYYRSLCRVYSGGSN